MSEATIAARYARALFEVGVETNTLPDLVDRVSRFARAYQGSIELRSVLENPLVEREKRDAILQDVANSTGLEGVSLNAVRLLASRHKLRIMPELAKHLSELSDQRAGILRASVTSAVQLPDHFYDRLRQQLETATQRRIVIERRVDPTLIAGVVTRIGDNTIDGSVRGRLTQIERVLRAS